MTDRRPNACKIGWTADRKERAIKMWDDGKSAREISEALGGVTRSAVCGMMNRLGKSRAGHQTHDAVAKRIRNKRKAKKRTLTPEEVRARKARDWGSIRGFKTMDFRTEKVGKEFPAEPLPQVEELVIPLAERKTLLVKRDGRLHANDDFGEGCCRGPIGDPREPDFHFCGKEKVPGLPYCEFHASRFICAFKRPNSTAGRQTTVASTQDEPQPQTAASDVPETV